MAAKKEYDVISPWKLAHVVLRTTRFKEMADFYKKFLGQKSNSRTTAPAFSNTTKNTTGSGSLLLTVCQVAAGLPPD